MRPSVAVPSAGIPIWVMALGIGVLAIILFSALDSRRRAASAPPVRARYDDVVVAAQPLPTLVIPPAPARVPIVVSTPAPTPPTPAPPRYVPPPPPQIVYLPAPAPPARAAEPAPVLSANSPAVVLDIGVDGTAPAPPAAPPGRVEGGIDGGDGRTTTAVPARAGVLRRRMTTVTQGTLIPAVLEAALDSTRAGLTRAVVSRDVRGFDGSRVLIPRGSRLFGDYRGTLQPGQNRALIVWSRLVRPDGVTIALNSPASDTLGRAGVRGKVDSHFLARFGAAILQSTLDVGVSLASRLGPNNNSVIVALPATGQTLSQPLIQGANVAPTLRVRQGTSISVFVARDLDFTGVEQ